MGVGQGGRTFLGIRGEVAPSAFNLYKSAPNKFLNTVFESTI